MITRNRDVKVKKTPTAKNSIAVVLLEEIKPHKSVKSKTTRKSDSGKECHVKLIKLNPNSQNRENCPKGEKVTPNKDKLKKYTTYKDQNKPKTTKKSYSGKECQVKLIKLNPNGQNQENCPKDEKATVNKNKPNRDQKKQKELQKNLQPDLTSTPVIKLRTRRPVKYSESSLEITKSEEKGSSDKVPIYQQFLNKERSPKRKEDQYEFDSDSEKRKRGKRRKLDDSSSYSETIENIARNIAKKAKPRRQKVIHQRKPPNNKKTTIPVLNMKVNTKGKDCKSEDVKKTPSSKIKILSDLQLKPTDELNLSIASPRYINVRDIHQEPEDELNLSIASPRSFQDDEPSAGDIHLESPNGLNFSIPSPRLFKDGKPNANSTMINRNVLTPWRFSEINITRNPHFITLKQSALPCISQEMVLDHTLVGKLHDHTVAGKLNESTATEKENFRPEGRVRHVETKDDKKKFLQPTLHDYFDNEGEDKENGNRSEISLFDIDQLSPIKTRHRIASRVDSARRKILVEKNDVVAVPADDNFQGHTIQDKNERNEILTNFGFDSGDDDCDIENEKQGDKNDRPFRLSVNRNDKKYKPKQKIWTKQVEPVAVSHAEEETSSSDSSDVEWEEGEIGLFEDFSSTKSFVEIPEENFGMKNKIKKHNDNKGQKKRKDVRTKEEEEEAEKWAEAFNSMCEEIEQFPLEIE